MNSELFKTIAKKTLIGATATLLLTACVSNQNTTPTQSSSYDHHTIGLDTLSQDKKVVTHKKKRKHSFKKKQQKVDLKKFCFKDNSSIHYRAKERCK